MATTRHNITAADGWVLVADSANTFLLEVIANNKAKVQVTFQESAPVGTVPAHTLSGGEVLTRLADGDVYISTAGEASVVVSTAAGA